MLNPMRFTVLFTLLLLTNIDFAFGQRVKEDSLQKVTEFNKGNLYDPIQLIQARLAGVSITRPGGDLNNKYQIRIRGLNTITSENEPLVIIDNMVGVAMDHIDPNDIESIVVLKQVAATALYGMRGANGVILVTSKRAHNSKPVISAYTAVSIDQVGKTYDVLDRAGFLALGGIDYGASTNWVDETTQTGLSEAAGLSISQKLDKTTFSMSANYRDIEGIVSPSFQKRLNARFSVEHLLLNDKLKISGQVLTTNSEIGRVNPIVFREAMVYNPTAPIFDPSNTSSGGFFQHQSFESYNPKAIIEQQENQQEVKKLLLNFSAAYQLTDDLNIQASYTKDNRNTFGGQYWSKDDFEFGSRFSGVGSRSTYDQLTEIGDLSFNYKKRFSGIDFNFLLGTSFQNREDEYFFARVTQFLFDAQTFNNLGFGAIAASPFSQISSSRQDDRLNSYYGRIDAQFSDKFSAYLNLRSDTYSGFINDKTGLFYGVGIQYDLIRTPTSRSLSFGASYGTSGNLPPSPNLAETFLVPTVPIDLDGDANTTDDIFVNVAQAHARNPTLKWEETTELNLGLSFTIESFGLSGSFDYFNRKSEDIVFREFANIGSPNPYDPGQFYTASAVYVNSIDISTSGLELTLNYEKEFGQIKWQSQFNFTKYQPNTLDRSSFNEIIGTVSFSPGGPSNLSTRSYVGSPIADLYAPRLLSVDDNGIVQVSSQALDDWEKVGNALPTSDIGFYNGLSFGDWELNFLLRGSFGHSLFNVTRWFYEPLSPFTANSNSVVTNKFVGARESTFSDNYIESASFLRLNHLALSRKFQVRGGYELRLEFIGQNLFTITDYSGLDPEARYVHSRNVNSFEQGFAAGLDQRNTHFTTRTYTLALKMTL